MMWCWETSIILLHHPELVQLFDHLINTHVFGMRCCEISANVRSLQSLALDPAVLSYVKRNFL